jgi:hypothetical protein
VGQNTRGVTDVADEFKFLAESRPDISVADADF